MGVYIKGMEMPVDCLNCKFCNTDFVEPYCRLLMRKMQIGERREDCPLVPVPPHGRLIDRDALTSKKKTVLTGIGSTSFSTEAVLMFDIKKAPTIIPASEEAEA